MRTFDGPDFLHDTPPRIMGSETEFTMQTRSMPDITQLRSLGTHTLCTIDDTYLWLDNGGLVYYDSALERDEPVLEYATPECSSAGELCLYEKAGERLALQVAREIVGNKTSHPLYKRTAYRDVYDSTGIQRLFESSIGHHENYSTPLLCTLYAHHALASYLATRPLWSGAGIVTPTGFQLSQRARAVSFLPQKHPDRVHHGLKTPIMYHNGRIEVRSGDGNMLPNAIRTKYAMTSLVLRLIEHEIFPDSAIYWDEYTTQAASETASAEPHEKPLSSTPSAIQQQTLIARHALRFAENHPVPAEELAAARQVHMILQALSSTPSLITAAQNIGPITDWSAKLTRMHYTIGRSDWDHTRYTTESLPAVYHDLSWEEVGDNTPSTQIEQLIPGEIDHALNHPPHTRAKVRTDHVRSLALDILGIQWNEISFKGDMPDLRFSSAYYDHLDEQEALVP
ncbi:MAG: proteasome accessory factor PafA2 family protein [Candidatus Saccharimonas sp.]